jgi:hypothetical protein
VTTAALCETVFSALLENAGNISLSDLDPKLRIGLRKRKEEQNINKEGNIKGKENKERNVEEDENKTKNNEKRKGILENTMGKIGKM